MGPGARVLTSIAISAALLIFWLKIYESATTQAFGEIGLLFLGGPILLIGFPLIYGLRSMLFSLADKPILSVPPAIVRIWTYAVFSIACLAIAIVIIASGISSIMDLLTPWLILTASWIIYAEIMDRTRPH